jgi:hypothetical protein
MSSGDFSTHRVESYAFPSKHRLKTLDRWIKTVKNKRKVWKKPEISALCKLLNSRNYEKCEEIKIKINELEYVLNEDKFERKITKEQTKYGLEYLNTRYFKKRDGSPRKKCPMGEREISILKDFSHFTLFGLHGDYNRIGSMQWYRPIYRVYSKTGQSFAYIATHWGEIEIIS